MQNVLKSVFASKLKVNVLNIKYFLVLNYLHKQTIFETKEVLILKIGAVV